MSSTLQALLHTDRLRTAHPLAAILVGLAFLTLCVLETRQILAALMAEAAPATPVQAPSSTLDELGRQVVQAHLFGRVEDASPERLQGIPETTLQLTLRGAFAGDQATSGSAIIEVREGVTRSVRAGRGIDQGVLLREVHPGHVVLERDGRLELLYFPNPDSAPVAALAGTSTTNSHAPVQLPSALLPARVEETSADERRQMIRQRLEELRQHAARSRALP